MTRRMIAMLVGLAMAGAASPALAEPVEMVCQSPDSGARSWRFVLDAAMQAVSIDAPVNWTWVTAERVLFLHATTINGRQYATQTYTLDRRTLGLEVCDFTGGADQPVACQANFQCVARPVAPSTADAASVHRSAAEGAAP